MTLPPARIEAAARAIHNNVAGTESGVDWDKAQELALDALAAAIPELANGTAWLAPITPTDAMTQAALSGPFELAADYAAMRIAHLKEDNPGGKEKDAG